MPFIATIISAPQRLSHLSAKTWLAGPNWRAQGGQRCARVRLYDRGSVRATAEEYSPSGPQSPPAEHAHMSRQRQAQAGTLSCGSPILDAARRMNYTDRRCTCTTGTATASSCPCPWEQTVTCRGVPRLLSVFPRSGVTRQRAHNAQLCKSFFL